MKKIEKNLLENKLVCIAMSILLTSACFAFAGLDSKIFKSENKVVKGLTGIEEFLLAIAVEIVIDLIHTPDAAADQQPVVIDEDAYNDWLYECMPYQDANGVWQDPCGVISD
jgi:hypothetical protein